MLAAAVLCGCWSAREIRIINSGKGCMRVLSVDDIYDSVVLRAQSISIPYRALGSSSYRKLCERMLATVKDPRYDGVGIAAPQVGINRRLVAVQRFDKPGEPFELYPNIRILNTRGELVSGPEGCLSVPGRRGEVLRYRDIDIRYTNVRTLRDTVESVSGFTAVIFQHETDHLTGVLYIDKLTSP